MGPGHIEQSREVMALVKYCAFVSEAISAANPEGLARAPRSLLLLTRSIGRQSGCRGSKARRGLVQSWRPRCPKVPPQVSSDLPASEPLSGPLVSGRPPGSSIPHLTAHPGAVPPLLRAPPGRGLPRASHQPLLQSLIHCRNHIPKQWLQRARGAISGKAPGPQAHAHPAALLSAGLGLRRQP